MSLAYGPSPRRWTPEFLLLSILATAGFYAPDRNLDRLAEDHANARLIAERIAGLRGIELDLATVETNIILFRLAAPAPAAAEFVAAARQRGVLLFAFGLRIVRAATHLDLSTDQCVSAAQVISELASAW